MSRQMLACVSAGHRQCVFDAGFRSVGSWIAVCAAVLCVQSAIPLPCRAAETPVARVAAARPVAAPAEIDLLAAQIEAGEFAPALALARQAPAGVERDQALQAIAQGQARAGAGTAALATLAELTSDLSRNQAIESIGSLPGGGFRDSPFMGGARGGGAQPDFETLMDLITTTVAPDAWTDTGGQGAIMPFRGAGVWVDAEGVLARNPRERDRGWLEDLRREAAHEHVSPRVRQESRLRMVSLPRLEREIQLRLAACQPLDEEMLVLAGLERIEYVLVYPETGDLVLAGSAGDWTTDGEGRLVSVTAGRPLVRLDDLVTVLRHVYFARQPAFGCSIEPTTEGLARARQFIEGGKGKSLKRSQRRAWLEGLQSALGQQNLVVEGIDSRTHVGQVLFEADYHMKLVGIGLEDGTLNVPSYLESIVLAGDQAPPPMDVLRWWFTMQYSALVASEGKEAYKLGGQGVRVQSENELLTETGARVHTGQASTLNEQFAHRFTAHFAELAQKYPVYAELQNIFDLALVVALMRSERLADRVDWHLTCFGPDGELVVPVGPAPKTVASVVNYRVINRKHVVAAVSGGVRVDPVSVMRDKPIKTDPDGDLRGHAESARPAELGRRAWWWD